eukprot:COSAG05_NODE_717_length_7798_cov_5.545915_5_plen_98_part_00
MCRAARSPIWASRLHCRIAKEQVLLGLGVWRQRSAASPLATKYNPLSTSHTSAIPTQLSISSLMGLELRAVAETIMSDLGMGEDQGKIDALALPNSA